jgi:hypothetical protein
MIPSIAAIVLASSSGSVVAPAQPHLDSSREHQGKDEPLAARRPALVWVVETGVDGLVATKSDRSIHTVAVDVWLGLVLFRRTRLHLLGGLAAAGAWGSITQLDETFEPVRSRGRAAGFGPGFAIRFEPYRFERISFGPELAGSFLLHTSRFPPGGALYNFMWRLGAGIGVRVAPLVWLWIHGRWHHASNARGIGPHNPSWEGAGGGVSAQIELGDPRVRRSRRR